MNTRKLLNQIKKNKRIVKKVIKTRQNRKIVKRKNKIIVKNKVMLLRERMNRPNQNTFFNPTGKSNDNSIKIEIRKLTKRYPKLSKKSATEIVLEREAISRLI